MIQRTFWLAIVTASLVACGGGAGDDAGGASGLNNYTAAAGGVGGTTASSCRDVRYDAAPAASGALPSGATLAITDATTKIRADAPMNAAPIAGIAAARNEYEMFQVAVRADAALSVTDVHFALPTLPTAGLSDLDRVMVYRAGYMPVTQPSNSEGAPGLWPDALIPKIDSYACEPRNAFPVSVPAGRNQSFYVEVYVPRGTPAGRYAGTLSVSGTGATGAFVHTQAVDLTVWDFTLPSTASLQNSFGFIGSELGQGHRIDLSGDAALNLSSRYALSGLRHRVAMTTGLDGPPPFVYANDRVTIDWSGYDAEVTPFMDGSAHHTGATWSAVQMRPFNPKIYATDGATGLTAYYKAWAEHFRARGWFDKLWGYTRDEPRSGDFADVKTRARAMLAADPSMRPLVTHSLDSGLTDGPGQSPIRIWTPLVNQMDRARRAAFDPYIQNGAQLWWYQSCESHGCFGEDVTGYPSYMIDASGPQNRVMEWLTFAYGIGGELYFNTMEGYFKLDDVWGTQFLFDGNGDGTLFYPGRPDRIGGSIHIPVESLRLKLIREGYEDYEYLNLLAGASGERAWLDARVAEVARGPRDFANDAQTVMRVRAALGARIEERTRGGVLRDRSDGR